MNRRVGGCVHGLPSPGLSVPQSPSRGGPCCLCSRGTPVPAGSSQGSCLALSFQQALHAYSAEGSLFLFSSLPLALDYSDGCSGRLMGGPGEPWISGCSLGFREVLRS